MTKRQKQSADDMLIREAEMVADHYLNENNKIMLGDKAKLVIAIMFPDPGVAERLVKDLGVTKDEADVMFLDAKFFLWACSMGKGMCPTKAIDEAWHNFILFTRDYFQFCEQIAGSYLHHVPHVGDNKPDKEAAQALYDKTQENIFKLFNINHLSDNWKLYTQAQCACGNDCGHADCCAVGIANKELPIMKLDEGTTLSPDGKHVLSLDILHGGEEPAGCETMSDFLASRTPEEIEAATVGIMATPANLPDPNPDEYPLPGGGGCSFKGRQEQIRQRIGRPLMKSPAMQKLQGIGDCSFAPACECGDDH